MDVLQTILALVVTLGILVTIHEYGHYWVARRCGVRVLRFSVGFGKPLFRWNGKNGTEYVVAALPLGGYVKMLDEREGEVAPELRHEAFNQKPVLQRIAIVSAGPLANFLFAILAYWAMFVWGVQTVAPVVGPVAEESPAALAGLREGEEILAVDGKETLDWSSVHLRLLDRLGNTGAIELRTRATDASARGGVERQVQIPIKRWLVGEEAPDPLAALGMAPYRPVIPAVLQEVVPDAPAQRAGLAPGDRILAVNDEPVEDWLAFVEVVRASPGQALSVEFERAGNKRRTQVTPGEREEADGSHGFIGAGVVPVEPPNWLLRKIQYGPGEAVVQALDRTGEMIGMIFASIKKMLFGDISVKNLSGPVTIAQAAGQSASYGIESFLTFLAYLSISLGVLNLLPIPVLDGGHLLYYVVELVRGRALSEASQVLGLKIGVTLIMMIMLVAFYNDLARL